MKTNQTRAVLALNLLATPLAVLAQDPRTNSWLVHASDHYARVYLTDAAKSANTPVTTWSNGSQSQSQPAYAGVQEVSASTDWVYIRSSGLALHVMGPWQNGSFPNLPTNRKALYRIPRNPTVAETKTLTGLGTIGFFADGVAMFDSRDGFVWTSGAESPNGAGYWNREAYVNEGATFDPGYAHQENTGTHHYHANPIALRYLMGDHVDFDTSTHTYKESTAPVAQHSPILGWVRDGFPVYGPYGYSQATNPASGLRRMVSGYQLRNGLRGTDNLSISGRATIPAWAQRLNNVGANQSGPNVSTQYPLGRYMEDNAFLGDVLNPSTQSNHVLGTDFDLDEYNGRWCITPEFPNGTYAYFVSIAENGTPVFPYNIGRAFFGTPTGSAVTSIAEPVVTLATGGDSTPLSVEPPKVEGDTVVLVWNNLEGGTYQVQAAANFNGWTTQAAAITNSGDQSKAIVPKPITSTAFRIERTALATFDPVTGTPSNGGGNNGGGGNGPTLASVQPTSAAPGATLTLTATLGGNPPPQNLSPLQVTLGTLTGTNVKRNGAIITAQFTIPSNAAPGKLTVGVVFAGPPGQGNVTFSLTDGFAIE